MIQFIVTPRAMSIFLYFRIDQYIAYPILIENIYWLLSINLVYFILVNLVYFILVPKLSEFMNL